jgi:hypothetical protein
VRYGGIFNGEISDNEFACQGGWSDYIEQMNGYKLKDKKSFNSPLIVPTSNFSD